MRPLAVADCQEVVLALADQALSRNRIRAEWRDDRFAGLRSASGLDKVPFARRELPLQDTSQWRVLHLDHHV